MILLRLVKASTSSAAPAQGGSLPRGRVFSTRLTQPRRAIALNLLPVRPADYDALMIGTFNVLIGTNRVLAIPQ